MYNMSLVANIKPYISTFTSVVNESLLKSSKATYIAHSYFELFQQRQLLSRVYWIITY